MDDATIPKTPRVVLLTDDDVQARDLNQLLSKHILLVHTKNLRELRRSLRKDSCDALFCKCSHDDNGSWKEVLESLRLSFPRVPFFPGRR